MSKSKNASKVVDETPAGSSRTEFGDTTDGEANHTAGNYTLRLKIPRRNKMLGVVTTLMGELGDVHDVDIVASDDEHTTRDFNITISPSHVDELQRQLEAVPGLVVVNISSRVFLAHLQGKLEIVGRSPLNNRYDLSKVYTPGVADVCMAIHRHPEKAYTLTIKANTILVASNGTRVLALGDIGPYAAMPVMEGKAVLFKRFANVNAVPICMDTKSVDEMVRTLKIIAPGYGGINLEDISSPECYEVERRLQEELDIPVFHDDRHGTAVVVVAAAINAAKLVKKSPARMKLVCIGTGAAGLECIKLLHAAGFRNIIAYNRSGSVHKGRKDLGEEELWLLKHTNKKNFTGTLPEALNGADMVLGLSVAGTIKAEWLKGMNEDAIVFALANPVPEVLPEEASKYVRVIATGGSNYSNQINNALAFPGIFRGLLDCRVKMVTEKMKLAAARALAAVVKAQELDEEYIIPSVFNTRVAPAVAEAIKKSAKAEKLARRLSK